MRTSTGLIAGAVFAALSFGQAHAAITGFHSTGADVSGGIDQAWKVNSGPAYLITNPGGVGWIGNTATSAWISNAQDTEGGGGPFTYTTTFNVGVGGSNDISGYMAADDQGAIYLNGNLVFTGASTYTGPWSYFQTFNINSGFVSGINTLSVLVPNNIQGPDDGPTGLQLGNSVPEPATWAMMLIGFAGLAFAGFRGARSKAAIAI